jgi:hypothetical protein
MKSTLFMNLIFSSLFVVAVGCGKENKSGSKSNYGAYNPYNTYNPYYQNPSQPSQQALANLQAWYTSTAEVSGTIGPKSEQRLVVTYSGGCDTKTILGFIDINICKSGSAQTSNTVTRIVNVVATNNKSQNANLAAVFAPANGGTLVNVTEAQSPVSQFGRLFTLTYAKLNGHSIQYKVDTGLNSAFSPVEIYDSELKRGERVLNPQLLY